MKLIVLEAAAISIMGFIAGTALGTMNAYFLVKTAVKAVAGFDLPLTFPTGLAFMAVPIIMLIAAAPALADALPTVITAVGAIIAAFSAPPKLGGR